MGLHKLVRNLLPREALDKIKRKHDRRPNVHLQPEDEVNRGLSQAGYLHEQYSRPREQDEQNGVKEADRVVDNALVYDGRDDKGEQLGHGPSLPQPRRKAVDVQVDVIVEPVMHHDVPLAVVRPEFDGIPPICVEGAVWETGDFGPEIQPAVQKPEEAHYQEQHARQHEVDDGRAQRLEVQPLLELLDGRLAPVLVQDEGCITKGLQ